IDLSQASNQELSCILEKELPVPNNQEFQFLDGPLILSTPYNGSNLIVEGGATVYHLSSGSYLVFDYCGNHNSTLDHFKTDEAAHLLLGVLSNETLVDGIKQHIQAEWSDRCLRN
ncbi:MAG: hypothetical protein AAGD96_22365, partial [Chloroflexota bacterium]